MSETNTNVTVEIEQDLFEFCHLIGLGHSDFAVQRKKLAGYIAQALADAEAKGIEKAAKIYEKRMMDIGSKAHVDSVSIAQNQLVGARQEIRALIKENG